jgi:hypothetical protein
MVEVPASAAALRESLILRRARRLSGTPDSALARERLGREVAERQCGSERDPGADVVARQRRVHIVAAGVEAQDRPVVLIQDFPARSGQEAPAGPEVARLRLDRIEGRPLDRPEAGVGRVRGIALVCVVWRGSLAEFLIDACRGIPVGAFDRALEPLRVDPILRASSNSVPPLCR